MKKLLAVFALLAVANLCYGAIGLNVETFGTIFGSGEYAGNPLGTDDHFLYVVDTAGDGVLPPVFKDRTPGADDLVVADGNSIDTGLDPLRGWSFVAGGSLDFAQTAGKDLYLVTFNNLAQGEPWQISEFVEYTVYRDPTWTLPTADGSTVTWFGQVFNPEFAEFGDVPEPSTAVIAVFGAVLLIRRRRNRV